MSQKQTPFPYRICYVEDSSYVSGPVSSIMRALLGAEVDLFPTTTSARHQMAEGGFNQWSVFVLDNHTGFGHMSGLDLAQQIRQNYPEALVVSLTSSDIDEMVQFGIGRLRGLGIEVWDKKSEAFKMIAWLADCAKENRIISREEWLTRLGESIEYTGLDSTPVEKALRRIARDLENKEPDESLRGVFMKRDTVEYLHELTSPGGQVERK